MHKSLSQKTHKYENKKFKKQKHGYLIYTWSDKAFKGTIVNQALPSLHGGSLEITLTDTKITKITKIWQKTSITVGLKGLSTYFVLRDPSTILSCSL